MMLTSDANQCICRAGIETKFDIDLWYNAIVQQWNIDVDLWYSAIVQQWNIDVDLYSPVVQQWSIDVDMWSNPVVQQWNIDNDLWYNASPTVKHRCWPVVQCNSPTVKHWCWPVVQCNSPAMKQWCWPVVQCNSPTMKQWCWPMVQCSSLTMKHWCWHVIQCNPSTGLALRLYPRLRKTEWGTTCRHSSSTLQVSLVCSACPVMAQFTSRNSLRTCKYHHVHICPKRLTHTQCVVFNCYKQRVTPCFYSDALSLLVLLSCWRRDNNWVWSLEPRVRVSVVSSVRFKCVCVEKKGCYNMLCTCQVTALHIRNVFQILLQG